MIEKTLLDYLQEYLNVPVSMEVPSDPPASFVVIQRTSGTEENGLKSAMMAVQSYGDSLLHAAETNEHVKDVMSVFQMQPSIAGCHLNSDYMFTDTTSKRYRYQAIFDVFYY